MRFTVYASSLGNCFFAELRDLLAAGLRELGHEARTSDERAGFDEEADWHVVVAAHEFLVLGLGGGLRRGRLPRGLVFYSAEQSGCPFYGLASKLFPLAREVWHLDGGAAGALALRGLRCRHVPPGYCAGFASYGLAGRLAGSGRTAFLSPAERRGRASWSLESRPLDVFFAGSLTPRRHHFFTRHAGALAGLRCCLRFCDARGPMAPGRDGALDGAGLAGLEQRSKAVLNVHRAQSLFFEWHRLAVHGFGQRALVVTEPVAGAGPFKAGRDFIEAEMDDLPGRLKALLGSAPGLRRAQEVATRGFETFSTRCLMSGNLHPAVEGLGRAGRAGRAGRPGAATVGRTGAASGGAGRRPACEAAGAGPGEVREARGGRVHGGKSAGGFAAVRARVTVAVSLRDYRRRVPACLDSVKAQTLEGLDLVVVDDASTDGSPEAVLRWLGRHGRRFRSWLLVRNGRAAGLAAARNAAFERSRTPYVFVLDADNLLLPRCLEALSSALDRCGADFAYSYLHRFGEEEFLMNVRPWDPELLRRRPLVDAMALVRRSAWRRVGGFRRQAVQGWEDHDFWLRLARSGGRGVLVPEVLGRYRVHLRSMIHSISPEDWERLRAEFMREHGASLDAENAAQGPAALGVFGGQDLPLRVDSAARPGPREAKGSYLVAALSILRDLNRDLLSGKGPSGRA